MSKARASNPAGNQARVRVWFGPFPIVDYTTGMTEAVTQAHGLERRFFGLRVTVEPTDALVSQTTGPTQ